MYSGRQSMFDNPSSRERVTQMNTMRLMCCTALAVLIIEAQLCSASIIVYTDRPSFDAAIGGATIFEGFENEPVDLQIQSRQVSFDHFDVTYVRNPLPNAQNAPQGFGVTDQVGAAGPSEGSKYLFVEFGVSTGTPSSITIDFHVPVLSFGMDDQGQNAIDLYYSTDTGESGIAVPASPIVDALQFWGITSDTPIKQIVLQVDRVTGGREGAGFDSIVLQPVPEPASAVLLLAAIAFVRVARRQRA